MDFGARDLSNDLAIITGASAGIGKSCALRLAQAGAPVVLGARRKARLDEVKGEIEGAVPGAQVHVHELDVTSRESLAAFLAFARGIGPIRIVVNNAGLAAGTGHVKDASADDWDKMLDTNVRAAFDVARETIGDLIKNGGDLVMMASVAGIDPYPGGAVYCATKSALQTFASSLRKEVLGHDVRVLTFDPGMVETEFSVVRFSDQDRAKQVYAGMRPLTGDDIADCVVFGVTRPRRMCIDRMLILSTDQSSATTVHRR